MRNPGIALASFALLLATACVFSVPFSNSLEKGENMPDGTVLLIGKMTVDPMIKQGNVVVHAPKGTHKGVIKMNFSDNADKPLDKNAFIPFTSTELMDFSFTRTSFIPLKPGIRFARMGTVVLDSVMGFANRPGSATPRATGMDIDYLMCYGDVKINVPQNAKAVYIGTIVYQHDLKNAQRNMFGFPNKKVVVRDEYDSAMADLAAMHIPGISPKNVVKKLAVVIRPN
jgi:hypothetical protein